MLLTGISTSSQTVTVASSFFAITQNSYAAGHNTVGINYGVLRFWNTNCVWSLIETSPGTYNWANCDTQINRAIAMNAAPDFVMGRTPLSHVTGTCTGTFSGSSGCAQLPSDLSTTNAVLPAFITALYNHMHTNFPSVKWSIEGVNEADLAGELCAVNGRVGALLDGGTSPLPADYLPNTESTGLYNHGTWSCGFDVQPVWTTPLWWHGH